MPDTTRTNEPNIVVETYRRGRVVYRDLTTGQRWAEIGECNQCGLCTSPEDPLVERIAEVQLGHPGAVRDRDYDTRPLYVTRPEWAAVAKRLADALGAPGCSLTFETLDGTD
jgi:hypothetical protein